MNGSSHIGGKGSSGQRRAARLCALALLAAGIVSGSAWACGRGELARELHLSACEPYARAAWLPPAASGRLAGVPIALGLARLHRSVRHMTGGDAGVSAVVPVLTMQAARGAHVVLMPTLRRGELGASVVVSLRLGD